MTIFKEIRISADTEVIIRKSTEPVNYSSNYIIAKLKAGDDGTINLTMPISVWNRLKQGEKIQTKKGGELRLYKEIIFPSNTPVEIKKPEIKIRYEADWIFIPIEIGQQAHAVLSMPIFVWQRIKSGANVKSKTN